MTRQRRALRLSLVNAGADGDVAAYQTQLSTLRADVSVVKWATALNTALLIAIALKAFLR